MGVIPRLAKIYTGTPIMPHSSSTMPQAFAPVGAGPGVDYVDGFDPIDINELITGGAEHYVMYTVTGDSMAPRIRPGDRVIIDPYAIPKNGDRVIVELGGLYSIKFFEQTYAGLHLVSSNGSYSTRKVTSVDEFRVVGVVKAAIALF